MRYQYAESARNPLEQAKTFVMRSVGTLGAIGLAGLAGYLTFADSKLDILGDAAKRELSADQIDEQFTRPWTAETRFRLQFLGGTVDGDSVPDSGSGILGFPQYAEFTIGSDCLEGSAYDTTPSEIRGRANGDISAVASVAMRDGVISVHPSGSDAEPLRFEVNDDGRLKPVDASTQGALSAYGC